MRPEDRIAELEEEVRQLKLLLDPPMPLPEEWKLTPAQSRIYRHLASRGLGTYDSLYYVASRGNPVTENNMRVQISKTRAKLEPFGITIRHVRHVGYRLDTLE